MRWGFVAVILASGCGGGDAVRPDAPPGPIDATVDAVVIDAGEPPADAHTVDAMPCVSDPVTFTVAFADADLLDRIVPLGGVSGAEIKPHTYPGMLETRASIPIYAPTDAELTRIAWVDQAEFTGYTLDFTVNCAVRYRFAHIEEPVDEIRAVGPEEPGSSGGEPPTSPYFVAAGDLIGHALAPGLDFGVYDANHTNPFANPARYDNIYGGSYYHARCPYDLYDEPLRSAYYAKFGGFASPAGSCTDCRNASMDVPGTIAGAWFVEPVTTGTSGPRLAAAADCDGTVRIGGPDFPMMITDGPDPKTVTGEHCYATADDHVFLRLSGVELHVAHGSGPCPVSFPATYAVFQR